MTKPKKVSQEKIEFNTLHSEFLQLYSSFEIAIEVAIKRLLRLSNDEASVVCGALGAGAKINLLKSLISIQTAPTIKIEAVTKAQTLASRNSWAHGIMLGSLSGADRFYLFYREAKEKFQVKGKRFTAKSMGEYASEFGEAYDSALMDLGLTNEDVHDYTRSILRRAPSSLFQDEPHPEGQTNLSPTNQSPGA
jgi:hypothetical protein